MVATPFPTLLRPIVDGEEVRQLIANRLPLQNSQRTDNLNERLNALEDGEAIVKRGVAISAEVQEGHAVYFDPATLEYKPGLATTAYDPETQALAAANSSFVEGVIYNKITASRGDLILYGSLTQMDWTNAIGSTGHTPAEAGQYYLSGVHPGQITKQRPAVGVFVATLHGTITGSAVLQPTPRSVLEDHIHFAYDIFAQPAGVLECSARDNLYTFISTDADLQGWLPADNAVFSGQAPTGAKFGYNLKEHPELERVWPPLPLESAYIEINGVGVDPARYQVDNNTLWWFDDCYGRAPWPIEVIPCGVDDPSSSSSSSSGGGEFSPTPKDCLSDPNLALMGFAYSTPFARRMRLYLTKMVVKTNTSVVTRLKAAEGSPITILNCEGEVADTGELQLDVDLSLDINENAAGYQVLKSVIGTTFDRGPVVEGLIAGANVTLTPVAELGESIDGIVRGRIAVDVAIPGSDQAELPVSIVALDGAREETLDGLFFLQFEEGKDSEFSGLIDIPDTLAILNPSLKLVFRILSRATSTLPELTLSVRRVPKNDPQCSNIALPATNTPLSNLTPGDCGSVTAGSYIEATSEAFAIVAGDLVMFTLGRLSTDTYPGGVGILRQRSLVESTS